MPIDRDVLEAVREMGEPELRRLLMLAQARLQIHGVALGTAAPEIKVRSQSVRCGKPTCSRCPHGPYWYAYWSEDGKRRSKYLGKLDELPEHVAQGIAGHVVQGVAGNDENPALGSTGS